jgi:hypothetical protein
MTGSLGNITALLPARLSIRALPSVPMLKDVDQETAPEGGFVAAE